MRIFIDIILFLSGLGIGHYLSVFRSKRKEFNEVADEVHFALKKQKERIEGGAAPKRGPEDKQIEKLKRRIPFYRRKKFTKALNKYLEATSSNNWIKDGFGDTEYKDAQKAINSIDRLIKFTDRI